MTSEDQLMRQWDGRLCHLLLNRRSISCLYTADSSDARDYDADAWAPLSVS